MYVTAGRAFYPLGMDGCSSLHQTGDRIRVKQDQLRFRAVNGPQNRQLREEGVGTIRCWIHDEDLQTA